MNNVWEEFEKAIAKTERMKLKAVIRNQTCHNCDHYYYSAGDGDKCIIPAGNVYDLENYPAEKYCLRWSGVWRKK